MRMGDAEAAYHELCAYTLELRDSAFIYQHVVDAFTAQRADARSKPIGLVFALLGLYLHVELGYTGKEVQKLHMLLGRKKRNWPALTLPGPRGSLTVEDVLAAPPGPERHRAIDAWSAAVWEAFRESRPAIVALLGEHGVRGRPPGTADREV
jgi:Family of unknown function (DUF5946)